MAHASEYWSPDDELLDRFVVEQAAPDERAAVEAWIARSHARRHAVQALRQARFDEPLSDAERMKLWQRVERNMEGVVPLQLTGRLRRNESRRERTGWYLLGGVALSAMLLLAGWGIGNHRVPDWKRHPPVTYSTARGERANVTLPDGSTAILNVSSRLDVPADYASGNHTVRITGEALFNVVHSGQVPFMVVAGGVNARVLGTTFLVRHYEPDRQTTIAVKDGKVAVGTTVLVAGRLMHVSDDGIQHVGVADPSNFSFATGTLTLREMTLSQAIPELDRWYDADIQLGDLTLSDRHIVGEFRAGSLADLRAILEMTFNVNTVHEGRTLTLFPK